MSLDDNMEPVARALAADIARRSGVSDAELRAWIDRYWECVAADLEAGVRDEQGKCIGSWEAGLEAYRARMKQRE